MSNNRGCLGLLFSFLRPPEAATGKGAKTFAYAAHEALLSPAERSFCGVLLQVLKGRYIVFAKVRLCDVLKSADNASLNKISQKHVDFVLCTTDRVAPVLAIELDDKSHDRPQGKARDRFIDEAFAMAGLPIIHLPVKRGYPTTEVLAAIESQLG